MQIFKKKKMEVDLYVENYLKKIIFLEEVLGAQTKYTNLEPFSIYSKDVIKLQAAARKIADFVGLEEYIFIVTKIKQKKI